MSLKVKWGYISVQNLETERSKNFGVSISLKTKAIDIRS